jgi:threonine/homoserine/homoserine lactone efflux protein
MLTSLFLQGSLIGFSLAMPVGPIAVLCIQHSLRRGLTAGLVAGLGAALADALYGGVAGCGVSLLSHVLTRYQVGLQIAGAGILWYLGIKIFKSSPVEVEGGDTAFSLSGIFFGTFALTLTNPLTMLCFAGIYTGFGMTFSEGEMWPVFALTLGVLIGSAVWWSLLSCGVNLIGKKLRLKSFPLFNRVSGLMIIGCACLASLFALQQWWVMS